MKIRGSWASVGNPFARYLANPRYEWNPVGGSGQWSNTTQYPAYNLKPERTNSFEVGLTMKFLKSFDHLIGALHMTGTAYTDTDDDHNFSILLHELLHKIVKNETNSILSLVYMKKGRITR